MLRFIVSIKKEKKQEEDDPNDIKNNFKKINKYIYKAINEDKNIYIINFN